MANPYALDQIQPAANDAAGDNPYALGSIQADGRTALRGSLLSAQAANPDQTAEAVKLSRTTGSPYEAIQANLPEVQQGVRLDDYEKMLAGTPATRKFLTQPQNAAMSNDDVGTLTGIEKAMREFMSGGGARIKRPTYPVMTSAEYSDAVRRARQDNPALDADAARALVMNGAEVNNQISFAGPVRGPDASAESVVAGLAGAASRMPQTFSEQLSYIAADILGLDKTQITNRLANLETRNQAQTPAFETETGKGLYAGGVSTIQNAPGMAMSIATGNPAIGLGMAGAQSAVPAYSKYRERGASGGMAAAGALGEGAVEVVTELLPMQSLLKVFGKGGQGAAMQFLKSQFQEQWTEQIATVAQDAIDTAIANPNKTWGEFVKERPGAAYQTFLATLVQSGAVTTAHAAAQKVTGAAFNNSENAARAEQAAAGAESLAKLAEASKLRERDPESFAAFVNQVAEDSDTPTDLYIDAEQLTNSLNQAGITMERLAMVAPAVAGQLRAASFVPGADIRVPVAEFAAAGPDITTPLIDHLRETPDAMSRAEAQDYLKTEGDKIRQEVETQLGTVADRAGYQQGIDQVRDEFKAQLDAVGKFRPEVNTAYATMLGNFYAAQAARAGVTPQELLAKYRLNVTGKDVKGAQTLEQTDVDEPAFKNWFGESKVVDAEGKPQVVYHSTGKKFTTFDLKKATQGIIWFTNDKAAADAGYDGAQGSGVVMDLYASLKNPAGWKEYDKLGLEELRQRGYDGVLLPESDGTFAGFAFEPNQLKSASKNNGDFDPAKANILKQSGLSSVRNPSNVDQASAAVAAFLGGETLPNKLGSVVTATAADIKDTWEPLIGRNVQMESEGDAGATQAFYDPASKTVFLIADRISRGDEAAVLAHELMHKHGQAALGKAGWDKLHGVIDGWANAPEDSDEAAVYRFAKSRVEAVGAELSSQEMFPYAVEAALKMGVQPSKKAKGGTVSRWLADVQAAMQDAWGKVTGKPETFGAQDLVNLAYGIAQMENPALALTNSGEVATKSIAEQSADPETGLPQFAGANGLFIGFAAPTERLEFIPTDDSQQMLNFVIMRDGNMIGSADLLFEGGELVALYDIEFDKAGRGKGDGSAVIQTLLAANPSRNVEISNIVEQARNFWESVGVPAQNLGPGEAYDGTLNWQTFLDSRAGQRAARSNDGGGQGTVRGTEAGAAGASQSGDGQAGNQLNQSAVDQTATPQFKKWFGDSKVVDDAGKPLVVYHGTNKSEDGEAITMFDTYGGNYGLFGLGAYFTEDPEVASSYVKKGRGVTPTVYAAYMRLNNPIDMDATADPVAWQKAFPDVDFSSDYKPLGATNEAFYRQAEEYQRDMDALTYEAAEELQGGLREMGYDGITHVGGGRVKSEGVKHQVFIAFDPEQIKSAIGNNGDFDPANPNIVNQGNGAPRATLNFASDITQAPSVIALLEGADLSSFLHESGHFFLEVQADLASRIASRIAAGEEVGPGERGIVDDMNTLLKWFGVTDTPERSALDEWADRGLEERRDSHETFARGFERYAMEGKAPSQELQSLFSKFRSWLVSVYRTLASLNVELTDDVREVMDRMLATDQAIEEAQAARNMGPLFQNAEQAGMTPKEYDTYQFLGERATAAASEELDARLMKDMKWLSRAKSKAIKAAQAEADDIRRDTELEVRREVMSRDIYRAWSFLTGKQDPIAPGTVAVEDITGMESGKLRTSLVKDIDPEAWSRLSERRMTSEDRGLHPDIVADVFGFSSGDELVKKLAAAAPPAQVIADLTDSLMLERYGDITSAEALNRAADEAVHNELRARVIATELTALQKAGQVLEGKRNTVNVLARAAKDFAAQIIARQRVRDLRPSQYTAAEARSAKLAEQALGKDMAEAALHKRNQLINNYAARAAYDAQDEVKAMQAYFRKFDKRRDSIDAGYQDQIEQLLEDFDFKPVSLKAVDARKSFAAWYEEQAKTENPPDVPAYLIEEAGRKSYKDITVEELRGLRDTVKQIEHQGRLKNKLLLARDQRDFDAAATQMANSIIEHGGEARKVDLEGPNPVVDWFAGVAASHRKLASLFRQMDGNKDSGPMYDLIGRAMNERGTMEDVMVEKATVALRDIYAPLMKMRGGITGYRSKLYIPEIDASLTRGGRLAVALNWGNEANRQRIMDGDKWSAGQVQAILKTLTPAELKFINDVWAYIDSYWEAIAAKEKRLTGVEPEKVVAQPFAQMAADGTEVQMTGGYYPLKYDTDRSDRADQQEAAQAAKEMMQGVMTRATTRRGHTKERLKEVKRAVRKDLNVVTQHITQVTHDLAWHEWLIDTNKLLQDERVVSAIRNYYGPKVLKTIRDNVLGIATADVVPQTDVDKALLTLRGNVTRATMGASLTTAFLQPFGLTQSMVRIGPKHVLRGMARWGGDAARMENTVEWIRSKSEFMRLRSKTFNKELREIRGAVGGKSQTMRVVDAGLFALMQKMQLVADVPTWVGQYEKSIGEGLNEDAAVAMADRAVLESQGGGATKDLAEVQRKHPMLTQFYSYFSVTLNLAAEQTAATDFKNPAAVAGWLGDMALLMVIPAILPPLIMYGLKGGDDDDEKGWAKRIAQWQLGYLMGTVVGIRELSGAVSGFDYAGPPVGRIIADIGKAGKQTAQGDIDEPAVLAYINLMGTAFGIPVVQAMRSYKGWKAWDEGQEGAGPQSILFGPPPKD